MIVDPACGTGGFLLAAHAYLITHAKLDRDQKLHLKYDALRGVEIVDGVARLCAMNLFLHGVGPDDDSRKPPIETDDALRNEPPAHADVVMTNPPFGKKSSITVVNDEGDTDKQTLTYTRPDFWTTTSNKQLNFVQHVKSLLKIHRRGGGRPRQRAPRGWCGRDGAPEAPARVRPAHGVAAADGDLLRPGRQGERPLLRAQAW